MGQRDDAGLPSSSTEMSSVVLEDSTERTKVQEDRFRNFLFEVSKLYDGLNYKWLRFLLYEHLTIGMLGKDDIKAMTLFNELDAEGHISCTNVILLSEIADVTQLVSAKSCITRYKGTTPCKKGKVLSEQRKTLFRALREVADNELQTLISFYKFNHFQHKFNDIWDLVFDLEKEKHLDVRKQDKWIEFANLLNRRAKDIMISLQSRIVEAAVNTPPIKAPEGMQRERLVTKVTEEAPTTEVLEETSTTEVPEETPATEIPEETPATEIPEETPATKVLEETPATEVPKETPAMEVLKETPATEVLKETPATEVPEETPATEVLEETPTTEVLEETPATEVPEETPATEILEETPATVVIEGTPAMGLPAEISATVEERDEAQSAGGDGPNVVVQNMALFFNERELGKVYEIGDLNLKKVSFVIKEGADYHIQIKFIVAKLVERLRFKIKVTRMRIKVEKNTLQFREYKQSAEPYDITVRIFKAPTRMLGHGNYKVKSKILDKNNIVLFKWKWILHVRRNVNY